MCAAAPLAASAWPHSPALRYRLTRASGSEASDAGRQLRDYAALTALLPLLSSPQWPQLKHYHTVIS